MAAAQAVVRALDEDAPTSGVTPTDYTVLGYRQTAKSSFAGGKANTNGFRFRHKSMRAIARTAKAQPFISGHDWGDVRARGGTIAEGWAEQPEGGEEGELGLFMRVHAVKQWAIEGFQDGTIDRFSIGAIGIGEIICTIHDTPVWSDCWCWPGMRTADEGIVAEWEYESARIVELSGVNVPAVEGTEVVEDQLAAFLARDDRDGAEVIADLEALCGRRHDRKALAATLLKDRWTGVRRAFAALPKLPLDPPAPVGGFAGPGAAPTMASMDPREQMARALGLDPNATWEQILAKQREISASAGQATVMRAQLEESRTELATARTDLATARAAEAQRARELEAAHVESEIKRLRATRTIGDKVVTSLRAAYANSGAPSRTAFDAAVALVEGAAPEIVASAPGETGRAPLQSDAKPAANPGVQGGGDDDPDAGPDAYDQHRNNPHLRQMMRTCRLSVSDVRQHGPRSIPVVPNLRELVAATERRGG